MPLQPQINSIQHLLSAKAPMRHRHHMCLKIAQSEDARNHAKRKSAHWNPTETVWIPVIYQWRKAPIIELVTQSDHIQHPNIERNVIDELLPHTSHSNFRIHTNPDCQHCNPQRWCQRSIQSQSHMHWPTPKAVTASTILPNSSTSALLLLLWTSALHQRTSSQRFGDLCRLRRHPNIASSTKLLHRILGYGTLHTIQLKLANPSWSVCSAKPWKVSTQLCVPTTGTITVIGQLQGGDSRKLT